MWDIFSPNQIPVWLKIAYTTFTVILIPIYWHRYGPGNFLWFSDIALLTTTVTLWLENSLLASMMALSVVILESVWIVDFVLGLFTGSSVIGLSAYMFDSKIPAPIRALSLFHLFLPPLLLWLVYRLGYNSRALLWQTVLAWIVLPVSYLLTRQSDNVNWVYGFGTDGPQKWLPPTLYLVLLMLAFPLVLYLPTHFLFKKLFS